MKAKEVRQILQITAPTLSKYVKENKISVIRINPYHYIYNDEDVYKLIGIKKEKHNRINISYSRVSSNTNKKNLKQQTDRIYEYCISKGISLDIQYEDLKSGMSYDRQNFNALLMQVIKGNVELIIIENKDRLVRFGFELIVEIFKYYGTKIIIINDAIQNKSYEQELADDLLSIIHYFSMNSYTHRRKLKKSCRISMITIKLPYKSTGKFQLRLTELRKQYSNIVRISYNQFVDGRNWSEVLKYCSAHKKNLSSFVISTAVQEGKQLYSRFKKQPNIIFGGKKNFVLRCQNKISNEEYRSKRLLPLSIIGETIRKGNRHFKLNIIDENFIMFKLNLKEHFVLHLPKIGSNYRKLLCKLEDAINNKENIVYSVKLTDTHIFISFEEFKELPINSNSARCIGIDLNPDTIGVSVLENGKVIHATEFSLKPIAEKFLSLNLASNSVKAKYYQNKLKFETLQISKRIAALAKHYGCQTVFIEDLKFKQKLSKEQKYNHIGNRKCRNLWKRELFVQNLSKRLNIFGIKIHAVNPAYSSFIGNLQNDYTDAINASIEIARRGYEYRILKNKNGFYPIVQLKASIQHQWKEMGIEMQNLDWKKLFLKIKNLKIKYRVSLDECLHVFSVFSLNNKKSGVYLYAFDRKLIV